MPQPKFVGLGGENPMQSAEVTTGTKKVIKIAWFKVDDQLAFNPKVLEAGNAAMGLWVRAGSWCAANLTDGQLPANMIGTLGAQRRNAKALVDCGLWVETETGYRFHDWEDFQPTKAEVLREREQARIRKQRQRANNVTAGQQEDSRVDAAFPVPSRPDVPKGTSSIRGKSANRDQPLPPDWIPNQEHLKRALETGMDLNLEAQKFKAHAEEKGRLAKNWNAAFTRWLMQAHEYAQRDQTRSNQGGFSRPSIDRQGDLLKAEAARIQAKYENQQPRLEIEP